MNLSFDSYLKRKKLRELRTRLDISKTWNVLNSARSMHSRLSYTIPLVGHCQLCLNTQHTFDEHSTRLRPSNLTFPNRQYATHLKIWEHKRTAPHHRRPIGMLSTKRPPRCQTQTLPLTFTGHFFFSRRSSPGRMLVCGS